MTDKILQEYDEWLDDLLKNSSGYTFTVLFNCLNKLRLIQGEYEEMEERQTAQ